MLLPQAEMSMVNVTICGIPTSVPKAYYDWVNHLAYCKECYHFNYNTWSRNDSCSVEKELSRKLGEYHAKRRSQESI